MSNLELLLIAISFFASGYNYSARSALKNHSHPEFETKFIDRSSGAFVISLAAIIMYAIV